MRKCFNIIVSLSIAFSHITVSCCFGLAPRPASQNPPVLMEMLSTLAARNATAAVSPKDLRRLKGGNAAGVLTAPGKMMYDPDMIKEPDTMLRAIVHEQTEKVMRILQREKKFQPKYEAIKRIILSRLGQPTYIAQKETDQNAYVVHVTASLFEILAPVLQGVISMDSLSEQEERLLLAFLPLVMERQDDIFTDEFLNAEARENFLYEYWNEELDGYDALSPNLDDKEYGQPYVPLTTGPYFVNTKNGNRIGHLLAQHKGAFNYVQDLLAEHWERMRHILEKIGNNEAPDMSAIEIEVQPSDICDVKCKNCIGRDTCGNGLMSVCRMEGIINGLDEYNRTYPEKSVKRIRFAGLKGEPLMARDALIAGIRLAKSKGFRIGLITNGMKLDDGMAEELKDIDYVHISLDAGSDASYESMKNIKGGYTKVLANIKKLSGSGKVKITVGYVLNKFNYKEIFNAAKEIKKAGASILRFKADINPIDDYKMTEEEISEAYENIRKAEQAAADRGFLIVKIHSLEEAIAGAPKPDFKKCYVSYLASVVGAEGGMFSCDHNTGDPLGSKKSFGRVQEDGRNFSEIIKAAGKKLYTVTPRNQCNLCPPYGQRVNAFMEFLVEAEKENAGQFINFVELYYVTGAKRAYAMGLAEKGEYGRAAKLYAEAGLIYARHGYMAAAAKMNRYALMWADIKDALNSGENKPIEPGGPLDAVAKNVIVTGGTGFIGRHLVERLLSSGKYEKIIILGGTKNEGMAKLAKIHEGIIFKPGDIRDVKFVKDVFEKYRPGTVYHLAGALSGKGKDDSLDVKEEVYSTNAGGTLNVARCAALTGARKVIYTSTAKVYGQLTQKDIMPIDENFPVNPLTAYARSKLLGENILQSVSVRKDAYIVRLSNVVGDFGALARTPKDVMARFICDSILDRVPWQNPEAASNKYDFIDIDTVIDTLAAIPDTGEAKGAVYNLASGHAVTLEALLDNIKWHLGTECLKETKSGTMSSFYMEEGISSEKLNKALPVHMRVNRDINEVVSACIRRYEEACNGIAPGQRIPSVGSSTLCPFERGSMESPNTPLYLKNDWQKKLKSDDIDELHIITAGGGGDVLGGALIALELRHIIGRDIKVKIFTSNLKRGDENPAGGPLPMEWVYSGSGENARPIGNSKYFYEVTEGLYVKTPICDQGGKNIEGYTTTVPLSEGKIVKALEDEGIELIMTDVAQSGEELARNYVSWQGERLKNIFVVGLDMGGDILARFPGPISTDEKEKANKGTEYKPKHPEFFVRSPNTDAVFLDMFATLENTALKDNLLLGVSALGGDGELTETLPRYIADYFNKGDLEGVLDNIRFFSTIDPSGNRYRELLAKCVSAIPSEVSGNFIMRLFALAKITPRLEQNLVMQYGRKTAGWARVYEQGGRKRGFSPNELTDPAKSVGVLCGELKDEGLSRQMIRGDTRTEVLPLLYPLTLFIRPSSVHKHIQNKEMRNTGKGWREKDAYLRETMGYDTETNDGNNVRDRALINSYKLKIEFMRSVWQDTEEGGKIGAFRKRLEKLPKAVYPDVRRDLEAFSRVLEAGFKDTIAYVTHRFALSEKERQIFENQLTVWLADKEKEAVKNKNISLYMYSLFSSVVLEHIADQVMAHTRDPKPDDLMSWINNIYGPLECLSKSQNDSIIACVLLENVILPALKTEARGKFDEKKFFEKIGEVQAFLNSPIGNDVRNKLKLHFIRVVMPIIFGNHYNKKNMPRMFEILYDISERVMGKSTDDNPGKLPLYNSVFVKVLPKLIPLCKNEEECEGLIGVMNGILTDANEGKIKHTYFFALLDMLEKVAVRGQVKDFRGVQELTRSLRKLMGEAPFNEKDLSPVIRILTQAAIHLDSLEETLELVGVVGDKLKTFIGLECAEFMPEGLCYTIPYRLRVQIAELCRPEEMPNRGRYILENIKRLDFAGSAAEVSIIRQAEELFRGGEAEELANTQEAIKKDDFSIEAYNAVSDVLDIKPIDDFPEESVIRAEGKNAESGLRLLRSGKVALGFSAGEMSHDPFSHMNEDLLINIPETEAGARGFIEWKIFVADAINKANELEKPLPVVIMTGYNTEEDEMAREVKRKTGYKGAIIPFRQGPTKAVYAEGEKKGDTVSIDGHDFYISAGSWGFIKWLFLSGQFSALKRRGIKYLTHSNVNNPMADLSPATLGYFDNIVRKKSGDEPLMMVEFGDYREESGSFAVETTFRDGTAKKRLIHQSAWGGSMASLSQRGRKNFNLANYILNLDAIAKALGVKEIYDDPATGPDDKREAAARKIHDAEKYFGIKPVLKKVKVKGSNVECVFPCSFMDDLTMLGSWTGVSVDRDDRYVAIKSLRDAYDGPNSRLVAHKMNSLDVDYFIEKNEIVKILLSRGMIGSLTNETVDSIREKVKRIFLPNRVLPEDYSLVEEGFVYMPGAYQQWQIQGDKEAVSNESFREKLIDREIDLIVRSSRIPLNHPDKLKEETKELLKKVLSFDMGGARLIDGITNAESNMIVRQCIKFTMTKEMHDGKYDPFDQVNSMINDVVAMRVGPLISKAITREERLDMLKRLLGESVLASKIREKLESGRHYIKNIDDFYNELYSEIDKLLEKGVFMDPEGMDGFVRDVQSGKNHIVYFSDDNGEVIYHLAIIQLLMGINPGLKITLVPRGGQYGIDASYDDIIQALDSQMFLNLKEETLKTDEARRFEIIRHSPRLGGIDLSRVSKELRNSISNCTIVFSVGCINYEMLNGIKKPNYHILTVQKGTSELTTGRKIGDNLFIRHETGERYLPAVFSLDESQVNRLSARASESSYIKGKKFVIRFSDKITGTNRDVIDCYARVMQEKLGCEIKLVPSGQNRKEVAFNFECLEQNDKQIGRSYINIELPKEDADADISKYILRLTAILNMGIASSAIPDKWASENKGTNELEIVKGLISFIKTQYKAVTGRDLDVLLDNGEMVEALKNIVIILPRAYRINAAKEIDRYNTLAMRMLESA